MKIWFINIGFEEEDDNYDSDLPPWEQGYDWDDFGVYVTLDDKKPLKSSIPVIILTASYNMIKLSKNMDEFNEPYFEEMPLSAVTSSFYTRCIETIFEEKIDD